MKLNPFVLERPANLPRFTAREDKAEPEPHANIGHLFAMGADQYLHVGPEPLRVPPLPARYGAELLRLRGRIAAMQTAADGRVLDDAEIAQYMSIVDGIVAVARRCVRPCSTRGRVLRALGLWRPFRNASDREIGLLLDFLLQCRAMSSIRFQNGSR